MHEDYQLAYCPIAHITSLAFADNAFENTRLTPELLHRARVFSNDISYVKMHGTGTQIGDSVEMNAVASIFKHRHENNPLTVGSVKANVSHGEAASNIYHELISSRSDKPNYRLPA